MTEIKKPVSITSARSLDDEPTRKERLLRKQGVKPAKNIAQRSLDAIAGGVQPGESSIDTRRRGARRIGGTVLAVAVGIGGVAAVEGVKHLGEHIATQQHEDNLKPLEDFQNGIKLKKDMVAVNAGNFEGTATAWVREHAADLGDNGATQDLIRRVNDQANEQNYPGVQSNDIFVVPRDELSPSTIQELRIQP